MSRHVQSFNDYFGKRNLMREILKTIKMPYWKLRDDDEIFLQFSFDDFNFASDGETLFPFQCRLERKTYSAPAALTFTAKFFRKNLDQQRQQLYKKTFSVSLGRFPIMINSEVCKLTCLSTKDRIRVLEDPEEQGGYFVVEGREMFVRLIQVKRTNEIQAVAHSSATKLGKFYSNLSTRVIASNSAHEAKATCVYFLYNGLISVVTMFFRKTVCFPLVLLLKLIVPEKTDLQIYHDFLATSRLVNKEDSYGACLLILQNLRFWEELNSLHKNFYQNRKKLAFHEAPEVLRPKKREEFVSLFLRLFEAQTSVSLKYIYANKPTEKVVHLFLEDVLMMHCETATEKYYALLLATKKLFAFRADKLAREDFDNLGNQRVFTSGFLLQSFVKTRLKGLLNQYAKKLVHQAKKDNATTTNALATVVAKCELKWNFDLTKNFDSFLKKGSCFSLGQKLMQVQTSGLSQELDRINFVKSITQLESLHRGQYFVQMKTTEVRKQRVESFGFQCPVNTPDGEQIGLLTHLTTGAVISPEIDKNELKNAKNRLSSLLVENGGRLILDVSHKNLNSFKNYFVCFNGAPFGLLKKEKTKKFIENLYELKSNDVNPFRFLEIGFYDNFTILNRLEGVFLFLAPFLLFRRVSWKQKSLYISPREQTRLKIHLPSAANSSQPDVLTEFAEESFRALFSVVPSWTPFCNTNPSPRNMYQCTMLKQAIGIPSANYHFCRGSKLFLLENSQKPLVSNEQFGSLTYLQEDRPVGINCVIAVVSYTGFDMEDALIFNKASVDRGLFHCGMLKNEIIDLQDKASQKTTEKNYFWNLVGDKKKRVERLSVDGLPSVGSRLHRGDPFFVYFDRTQGALIIKTWTEREPATVVEIVPLRAAKVTCGSFFVSRVSAVLIRVRINRNPFIGDKFSSRHGQKGTLSLLWSQESMPFTAQGIVPDLIINPHAFPSRMTVGMFLEIVAGKAGALEGTQQESSPFVPLAGNQTYDCFYSALLEQNGFEASGEEQMISGVTGNLMDAKIFLGVCFYQKLKQMVKDKSQVREKGLLNAVTRQPLKGKRMGGGLRLGEMERDALISHGTSYFLKEKFLDSSDLFKGKLCKGCGSLITVARKKTEKTFYCVSCGEEAAMQDIHVPFATVYMLNELAAMGIGVKIEN